MAEFQFDGVWKIYDKKVEAVKDLTFTCKDKEFFAILGPSGCGKSSSLRMLAGLEEISKGDVYIDNKRVNELSPKERNVAMSFENYGLYPNFTVFENISYPLRLRKQSSEDIKNKVYQISRSLHLMDVLNAFPASLSSGQKQRVSIARALVRNPDVTIMDEPLSHLDSKMRNNMRSIIKKIHHDLGLTTVYVTHDQIEAMTMADRILIMDHGEVQQIGSPDKVYYKPNNLFVAGFIGTPEMNFFEGEIIKKGMDLFLKGEDLVVNVNEYKKILKESQKIILGIRPHDILITNSYKDNYQKGKILVVEMLGETTIISIKTGKNIIKAEVDDMDNYYNADDNIYYYIDSSKSHLFSAGSKERINF